MSTRRALFSTLAAAFAPRAADAPQHTLVCVFLRGGADTLNLVVPYADDAYYHARPTLAIKAPSRNGVDAACALRLDDRYGFHPALAPLEPLFKEGRLGIVQSVGLKDNTSGSHFECQDQMEHGDSAEGRAAGGGWLGRYLRTQMNTQASALSAVAIGTTLPESLRGAPSVSVLEKLQDIAIKTPTGKPNAVVAALSALYGGDASQLGQRGLQTLDLFQRVAALHETQSAPANGAEYPKERFGEGLREIARLIRARVGLEVACIDLPGWDSHFVQGSATGQLAGNAKILAEGLAALDTDLRAERSSYTVLVMTEFGRRVYENASLGTDHGRGFACMAIGDNIHGGQVHGPWPVVPINETDPDPRGPGGVVIEHDIRDVFTEVLRGAMGLADASTIFPSYEAQRVGLLG